MSRTMKRFLLAALVMGVGLHLTSAAMDAWNAWWPLVPYAALGLGVALLARRDYRLHSPYWQRRREWEAESHE